MTEAEIARVTADYGRAAHMAVEAGFDALEVHLGHNYLLSAFLSPKLNHRGDAWGGSVENRARFARAVVRTVREAVGDRTAVTAKLNMADGVPGGLWLEDSVEVARLLEADGALDALTLTGGSSLANPMYLFRGEAPREEFAATLPHRTASRVPGHGPAVHAGLPLRRGVLPSLRPPVPRRARHGPRPAGRDQRARHRRTGVDRGVLVRRHGQGAAARARPRRRRCEAGTSRASLCIHCNKCMPTIYSGTRCVLVDRARTRRRRVSHLNSESRIQSPESQGRSHVGRGYPGASPTRPGSPEVGGGTRPQQATPTSLDARPWPRSGLRGGWRRADHRMAPVATRDSGYRASMRSLRLCAISPSVVNTPGEWGGLSGSWGQVSSIYTSRRSGATVSWLHNQGDCGMDRGCSATVVPQ